jgi:hypothetical protein
VDIHALRNKAVIQHQSWDYYHLFFEKPPEYPIQVKYKDITYLFDLVKKRSNTLQLVDRSHCLPGPWDLVAG